MSRENVERLRVAFEAFLAGSSEFGGELVDPEIEWDATESPALDNTGVYRGIEGVRQFWREWLAAWETVQFEYELIVHWKLYASQSDALEAVGLSEQDAPADY